MEALVNTSLCAIFCDVVVCRILLLVRARLTTLRFAVTVNLKAEDLRIVWNHKKEIEALYDAGKQSRAAIRVLNAALDCMRRDLVDGSNSKSSQNVHESQPICVIELLVVFVPHATTCAAVIALGLTAQKVQDAVGKPWISLLTDREVGAMRDSFLRTKVCTCPCFQFSY